MQSRDFGVYIYIFFFLDIHLRSDSRNTKLSYFTYSKNIYLYKEPGYNINKATQIKKYLLNSNLV